METQKTKEQSYLDFLRELKSVLEVTQYVSMSKLCDKHGVGKEAIIALQDGKIIKNSGTMGRGAIWSWNTSLPPNEKMVDELIKQSYYETRKEKVEQQKEAKTNKRKVKKQVVKESGRTISILWGLIKIQSK